MAEDDGKKTFMNDITLFGRKVTRGKTMGQGADEMCKVLQGMLDECQKKNGTDAGKCVAEQADVLACRGNFLCPAVAAMWTRCYELQVKGKIKPEECENAKQALMICMDCNSTE